MNSSPYVTDILCNVSTGFRLLAGKNLMTECTFSLDYTCCVAAILICAILGDSGIICLLTSLTLELTDGTTMGFLSAFSFAISNFDWLSDNPISGLIFFCKWGSLQLTFSNSLQYIRATQWHVLVPLDEVFTDGLLEVLPAYKDLLLASDLLSLFETSTHIISLTCLKWMRCDKTDFTTEYGGNVMYK